ERGGDVGAAISHRDGRQRRRRGLHAAMTMISSLRGRIFLASALLAVLTCGVALFVVNRRVTNEGERSLQREILVSGAIVDQLRTTRTETYAITARLIADSPTLKAAVSTDAPTVQNELRKYGTLLRAPNLL